MTVRKLVYILLAWALPASGLAQDSHWGVVGSVTSQWRVPSSVATVFGGTVDIKGTDFTIGIARGRELGGDWGVSYVHKKLKDGSRVEDVGTDCSFSNRCFVSGESIRTQGVTVDGIEVHKFIPFATIKRRVQIGLNVGGGVGQFNGSLETHEFLAEFVSFDPRTGRSIGRQRELVTTDPAEELFPVSVLPLGKLQVAATVIGGPGFKIRAAGGLNFPGTNVFSLTGVVFFGAR